MPSGAALQASLTTPFASPSHVQLELSTKGSAEPNTGSQDKASAPAPVIGSQGFPGQPVEGSSAVPDMDCGSSPAGSSVAGATVSDAVSATLPAQLPAPPPATPSAADSTPTTTTSPAASQSAVPAAPLASSPAAPLAAHLATSPPAIPAAAPSGSPAACPAADPAAQPVANSAANSAAGIASGVVADPNAYLVLDAAANSTAVPNFVLAANPAAQAAAADIMAKSSADPLAQPAVASYPIHSADAQMDLTEAAPTMHMVEPTAKEDMNITHGAHSDTTALPEVHYALKLPLVHIFQVITGPVVAQMSMLI